MAVRGAESERRCHLEFPAINTAVWAVASADPRPRVDHRHWGQRRRRGEGGGSFYGQPWFLDVEVFGTNLRDLFQVHPINLSVAIWVGFLALFGIATDDGVVVATYLRDSFRSRAPQTVEEARLATLEAGKRRIRPCLMTTATTILALLPVLTSRGRGSDIMVPMAIPAFGGMLIEIITMLVVPVLFCAMKERGLRARSTHDIDTASNQ